MIPFYTKRDGKTTTETGRILTRLMVEQLRVILDTNDIEPNKEAR